MVRQRQIEIYSFGELEPSTQEKVINRYRENLWTDSSYTDMITEDLENYGEELFKKDKITIAKDTDKDKKYHVYWSVDWSHYNYATPVGYFEFKDGKKSYHTIVNSRRGEGDVQFEVKDDETYELAPEKIQEKFKKKYEKVSSELKKSAEKQVENLESDSYIREALLNNEDEYLANGQYAP